MNFHWKLIVCAAILALTATTSSFSQQQSDKDFFDAKIRLMKNYAKTFNSLAALEKGSSEKNMARDLKSIAERASDGLFSVDTALRIYKHISCEQDKIIVSGFVISELSIYENRLDSFVEVIDFDLLLPKSSAITMPATQLKGDLLEINSFLRSLSIDPGSRSPAVNPSNIASVIDRIRNSPHSDLPAPTATIDNTGRGGGWLIKNNTNRTLTVYFSGPMEKTITIQSGQSVNVSVVVGEYQIAAEVNGDGVLPFYGRRSFASNMRYSSSFFIR